MTSAISGLILQTGKSYAQLIATSTVAAGILLSGAWYLGTTFTQIRAQDTQIHAQEKVIAAQEKTLEAKIAQARAEAIQQTNDKFLMYGYAAEYQVFQNKALGKKIE